MHLPTFIVWSLAAGAFQTNESTPSIRVTGTATLSVPPEEASIDLGIVTEAPDAKDAARQNAQKMSAVLEALRGKLGANARIETISYSLDPVYRYPERSEPVLSGYSARNIVRVQELPLDKVGETIDLATTSGANSVSNVSFGLRDEKAAKARALRDAAADAKAKADTLADALGVRVQGILAVLEGEPEVIRPLGPVYRAELAMADKAAPTPIEGGKIQVNATVTLVVAIQP
jgi:uncharacterized protein YggE